MAIFALTNAFFKALRFLFWHLTVRLGAFLLELVKKIVEMLQNTCTHKIMCVYLCQQKQKRTTIKKNKHYDNNYENKARLN